MASDADSEIGIYLGIWTNWSRGSVFGATLTLTRFNANILIAFTSFFIGLVATRFWRLACFVLHRYYSRPSPQDGLHHQRQLILRNSQSAEGGVLSFISLYCSWRNVLDDSLARSLAGITLSILVLSSFIVAGGFSATISTSVGHETLVDGSNCGMVIDGFDSSSSWEIQVPLFAQQASNAASYAQQCYSSNGSGVFGCGTYVTPAIPMQIDYQAKCPFQNTSMCRTNASNIQVESTVNSHKHLGINARGDEEIHVKMNFHCAPIVTEGFTSNFNASNINYTRYHYGVTVDGSVENKTAHNYTYQVKAKDLQYDPREIELMSKNFITGSALSFSFDGNYSFMDAYDPIDGLKRRDGDTSIFFLAGNGVLFILPTQDPWYEATSPGRSAQFGTTTGRRQLYSKNEAASPISCINQFQFCHGSEGKADSRCGPMGSYFDAIFGAAPIFDLPQDIEAIFSHQDDGMSKLASKFHWFIKIFQTTTFDPYVLFTRIGPSILLSQQKFLAGVQGPLPDNQWQLEMLHLWNASLASLQTGYVSVARGTTQADQQNHTFRPLNEYQKQMCANQKILSTQVGSFSLFGLIFTYVIGLVIIVLSLSIDLLVNAFLFRRRQAPASSTQSEKTTQSLYKKIEWTTNEVLQQNRLAHEAAGRGTWRGCMDEVPTTTSRELLAPLNVIDPKHPTLFRQSSGDYFRDKSPNVSHTGSNEIRVTIAESTHSDTSLNTHSSRNRQGMAV